MKLEEDNFVYFVKLNKILLNKNNIKEMFELFNNKHSSFYHLLKYFKLEYFTSVVYSYLERYFFKDTSFHTCFIEERNIHEYLKGRITVKNVAFFYNLAKLYNLPNLAEETFSRIERCFAMVIETNNFLELDYTLVAKVFDTSDLHTTSEREVYNAADKWLMHNTKERCQFSKKLLLKVRLPLLSDRTLKYLLNESSSFTNNHKCIATIKEVLYKKDDFCRNKSNVYQTHRYCNKNKFKILFCGGNTIDDRKLLKTVKQIDELNFTDVKVLPSILEERLHPTAVCSKGEVYLFDGLGERTSKGYKRAMSVEKYSPSTDVWNRVADTYDDRTRSCACAFMDDIFVIGGCYYDENYFVTSVTAACLVFVPKDNKWKEVSGMRQARADAACAVFQGRIVVCGGTPNDADELKSVESYDLDGWSPMPSMIHERSFHSLVVVKSKLFVIGNYSNENCEVYDNISQTFVAFNLPDLQCYFNYNKVVSVGSSFFIFQRRRKHVLCYDVEKREWREEFCEVTYHTEHFSCAKVPTY